MPDISIIIVNYNNKNLLRECLQSVFEQTRKASFKVIVSDNASADGSKEMIRQEFPQVILIENEDNLGFIKASNIGLRVAQGKTCLLLNDDTVVREGALDKLYTFIQSDPRIGICGPSLIYPNGRPQRHGGLFSNWFANARQPLKVNMVSGACLLIKREVMDKIGLMDENLFFYNDDLDWCLSARKAGWQVYVYPEAKVMHIGGASTKKTFKPRFFIEGFRGGLYFCKKHYGVLAYNLYRIFLVLIFILILPFMAILTIINHQVYFIRLKAYFSILRIVITGNLSLRS